MTEVVDTLTKEQYEKAILTVNKVAEAVSKSEWNYERLKGKREKLLLQAFVAYWKSISLKDDFLYPIRLSYSTYEYDCGMLNENLTRELMNLDGVTSNGNEDIRQKRKAQVKRILELQDKITELHKRAVKLSLFYRSCVAQPRYQMLLSQDSDSPDIQLPVSPVPVEESSNSPVADQPKSDPVLQKQPSLRRKQSVHRITVLSPEEYEARKRGMEMECENSDVASDSEEAPCEMNPSINSEVMGMEEEKAQMEEAKRMEEKERERMEEEELARLEEEALKRKQKAERIQKRKEEEREKRLKKEEEEKERKKREEEERRKREEERKRREEEERKKREEEERRRMEEEKERKEDEELLGMEEEEDSQPEVTEEDDEVIESDYRPKYQWLQQGNQLLLMLMDVDFDQKSLRCITKPGKPTPSVIIQGYRIVKEVQPCGYYGMFYGSRPMYKYIPFTTVIPFPSIEVDLKKAPTAMYYDDQNILQLTYNILPKHLKPSPVVPKKRVNRKQPREVQRREEPRYYVNNPFYPNREYSAPYDPRYEEEDEEEPDYRDRYYRNPYSPYRQQRSNPYRSGSGSPFYPFFGGDMW